MILGTPVTFRNRQQNQLGKERDGETATIANTYGVAYTIQFQDGQRMYAAPEECEETI